MSVTNSIVCDNCKCDLVVGQGDTILYTNTHNVALLSNFFSAHKGHNLRFTDENDSSIEDYPMYRD